MYINKTTILGNITKDWELKVLPSGSMVLNFSIATNRSWKDKDGKKQEEVEYHNVVAFGKQADIIKQYCGKGDQMYVEGRLQTRSWDTDNGKRYATEIILENFQFGKKSEKKVAVDDETGETIPMDLDDIPSSQEIDMKAKSHDPITGQDISLDDIPF